MHNPHWMPDEVVHAVGEVTIAAGELELVLAWIGAEDAEGNLFTVLAKPSEPLRACRRSVMAMTSVYRDAFSPIIDHAAEVLAKRHSVVHAMWVNHTQDQPLKDWQLLNYRTRARQPANPDALDDITRQLVDVRNRLVQILTDKINNRLPSLPSAEGW